jgi:hypothetical protein
MPTPLLELDELAAAQSSPHVLINRAFRALEAAIQLSVADKDLTTPPVSPVDGDRYIVPANATGAWAGHQNAIAYYSAGWKFLDPLTGWRAYVVDEGRQYVFGVGSPSQWTVDTTQLSVSNLGSPGDSVAAVSEIVFSGAEVQQIGPSAVQVNVGGGGGGGGGNSGEIDPATTWYEYDDLVVDDAIGGYDGANSGGALNFDAGSVGHPGVVECSTTTGTTVSVGFTKGVRVLANQKPKVFVGGGELVFEALVEIPTLWGGGNTGQIRTGFMDEISGAPTDGIHAQYESGDANWRLYARAAGTPTSDASGAVAVTTGWHHVKIVVTSSSLARLFVDGVLAATVTSGLPTAGFTWGSQAQKTAGTTPAIIRTDFFLVRQTFTSPRY